MNSVSGSPPPGGVSRSPSPSGAVGFSFGADAAAASKRCTDAGKSWSANDGEQSLCSGTPTSIGMDASARLRFCGGKLCSITVFVPLAEGESAAWVRQYLALQSTLSTKYGAPAAKDEHIGSECAVDVGRCLKRGANLLELVLAVGRWGRHPDDARPNRGGPVQGGDRHRLQRPDPGGAEGPRAVRRTGAARRRPTARTHRAPVSPPARRRCRARRGAARGRHRVDGRAVGDHGGGRRGGARAIASPEEHAPLRERRGPSEHHCAQPSPR